MIINYTTTNNNNNNNKLFVRLRGCAPCGAQPPIKHSIKTAILSSRKNAKNFLFLVNVTQPSQLTTHLLTVGNLESLKNRCKSFLFSYIKL